MVRFSLLFPNCSMGFYQKSQLLTKINVAENIIGLIRSYLTNRKQYVDVSVDDSVYQSTSEVPQGSNLGPLLFLIAINGIDQVVKHFRALLFADDFKLFFEISGWDVPEWCATNGFTLNPNKCSSMTFSLKKNIISKEYTLNDNVLKNVT